MAETKPQGVILKQWEMEYAMLISNQNIRIQMETVKTTIRSAFEDGMFEQWRITLKCPLSGQRIKVPARYADCVHIECFDLEAFLRMKMQKNLLACPICQNEIEKPLANIRIDEYIETVLSTLPDAMKVELLRDGSFTKVHEEFVVVPNVIDDEEPYDQDSNAPAVECKQEDLEDDDECITLSDGEDESLEDIVEMKPISLMPLNMDIKPKIAPPLEQEQIHSEEDREIQDQQNSASQKASQFHNKQIHLGNASGSSIGDPKKRLVPLNDLWNLQKKKITRISLDIRIGFASFRTSEGQEYKWRRLSDYVSILRESEADVHGCEAHIDFPYGFPHRAELSSVLGSQEKFDKFLQNVRSISHLWKDGRISVELRYYSADVRALFSQHVFCGAMFGKNFSILKCKVLIINRFEYPSWPISVITNVAHHCKQLIFKQEYPWQRTFLNILYKVTLPRHVDLTLELNFIETDDFIYELEKRFKSSKAQYFKFKLLSFGFPGKSELPNDYGTLKMTKGVLHRDDSLITDTVIEQYPKPVPNQQST